MTYRQFKKYIKQLLAPWEYDVNIFNKDKDMKQYCIEEARQFKNKRQLQRFCKNN